jgi:hypothetical protein
MSKRIRVSAMLRSGTGVRVHRGEGVPDFDAAPADTAAD